MPVKRLFAPGLAALALFGVLIGLGCWQLQRLKWKDGIIAELRQAQTAPPVPLPVNPTPYQKVQVTGVWLPGKAALYGDEIHDTPTGPIPGGELIMALQRPGGEAVLVDLGWVPQQSPEALTNLPPNPVGYVHGPLHAGWFSGKDDPAHGLYYTLDPAKIGAGMGLGDVAPYMLIALGPPPPPGSAMPQPAQDLPTPPNNHYQYALTWFGLAAVLVFEFIFFARKRLQ